MVRTQIYPDEGQKSALNRLRAKRGATISDLIRQAVDQLGREKPGLGQGRDMRIITGLIMNPVWAREKSFLFKIPKT